MTVTYLPIQQIQDTDYPLLKTHSLILTSEEINNHFYNITQNEMLLDREKSLDPKSLNLSNFFAKRLTKRESYFRMCKKDIDCPDLVKVTEAEESLYAAAVTTNGWAGIELKGCKTGGEFYAPSLDYHKSMKAESKKFKIHCHNPTDMARCIVVGYHYAEVPPFQPIISWVSYMRDITKNEFGKTTQVNPYSKTTNTTPYKNWRKIISSIVAVHCEYYEYLKKYVATKVEGQEQEWAKPLLKNLILAKNNVVHQFPLLRTDAPIAPQPLV